MTRAAVAIAIAALMFWTACPAQADDKVSDTRAQAQALVGEANELVVDGRYVEALARLEEAFAIYPSPAIHVSIGTTLRQLGRNADAAAAYERYLAASPTGPTADEVRRILIEIDATVSRLTVRVKTVGAQIRLDTKILGEGPFDATLRVDPGEHTLVVEAPGMRPFVMPLTLSAAERRDVQAEPLPDTVVTRSEVVEVASGEAQRTAGIVVGSVGIAGLAVAAITGGLAIYSDARASEHCDAVLTHVCDARGVELGEEATTLATAAWVALGVGSALLVGGLVLYFTAPEERARRPAAWLVVGPERAAAGWSW